MRSDPNSAVLDKEALDSMLSCCAEALYQADGLLITAGAGMGVDSGLPDFRGHEGFWKAYPALQHANISFQDIASPDVFRRDPSLAWGFYGHRLNLYRNTKPHDGFAILQEVAREIEQGAFVYTSNVDGQFQKAGISSAKVVECHGSIHELQCVDVCTKTIWSAEDLNPRVDLDCYRLTSALPRCPNCGGLARPHVLMFSDRDWLEQRWQEQEAALTNWLIKVRRLLVLEIGAGTALPGVRYFSEFQDGFLIRINPTESELPENRRGLSVPLPAREALVRIRLAWQEFG